jgi:hypothetical protein
LIAAQEDLGSTDWGCEGTYIGAVNTMDGSINTPQIIAACQSENIAADLCSDFALSGYTDWYLPSSAELGVLFSGRQMIGGFNTSLTYWSSTEIDGGQAYGIDFGQAGEMGEWIPVIKTSVKGVRPIRRF